jgi:exosortase E/protease (VPEID-CTERM system)
MALLAAEVLLTVPIYKFIVKFDCWSNWSPAICAGFTTSMVSVYTSLPVLALLAMLLAPERRALTQAAAVRRGPLAVNLAGVAVFFLPVLMFQDGAGMRNFVPIVAAWGIGLLLAAVGALMMLAPAARWQAVLRARGGLVAVCLVAGIAAPFIAQMVQPLWRVQVLSDATFHAVVWLMQALGVELMVNLPERIIGTATFSVNIAPLCSGLEGIGLIMLFVTIYLVLFRRELRFPAALVLYPFGILASWLLNVVRIAVLISLGIGGHPDLAANGFHSHAGWLMFTILALGIVGLARWSGFFAAPVGGPRPVAAPLVPFLADPVVAQILPFAVFMASALLASTFANMPTLVYPLRAAAMVAALAIFLPYLRSLVWRLDPLALGAGLAIGVIWTATAPPAAGTDMAMAGALQGLGGAAFVAWVVARVVGTTVLVPVIEELFFRGYLLQRLMGAQGLVWRVALGVVVTSVLFGVLHDRWLLAGVAGAVYAVLRLRSGRISDAILAHAASNAWIAGAAILANDWSLI